jgi:hypothetical protein
MILSKALIILFFFGGGTNTCCALSLKTVVMAIMICDAVVYFPALLCKVWSVILPQLLTLALFLWVTI